MPNNVVNWRVRQSLMPRREPQCEHFRLLVAGFSFFATERVDQEDKIGGMRHYGSDLRNILRERSQVSVEQACGILRESAHRETASAVRLTLAEVPQVDHRIRQGFECVVQLTEPFKSQQ